MKTLSTADFPARGAGATIRYCIRMKVVAIDAEESESDDDNDNLLVKMTNNECESDE